MDKATPPGQETQGQQRERCAHPNLYRHNNLLYGGYHRGNTQSQQKCLRGTAYPQRIASRKGQHHRTFRPNKGAYTCYERTTST